MAYSLRVDDGDQSPASGVAAQRLRNKMDSVSRMLHILNMPTELLSAVALGQFSKVKKCLQVPEEERKGLLQQREPSLNNPCLTMCWLGSKNAKLQLPPGYLDKPDVDYQEVMRTLLDAGADPNMRDMNGYTALHHTTSHSPDLEMAKLLIKAGADVNARTRMGNNPLHEPTMYNNYASCKLLVEAGADPFLADNDGCTAADCARMYPALTALYHRRGAANRKSKAKASTGYPGDPFSGATEPTALQMATVKEYLRGKGQGTEGKSVNELIEEFTRQMQLDARDRGMHKEEYAAQADVGSSEQEDKVRCSACQKLLPTKAEQKFCSQCKVAVYCGPACQKVHWKQGHKQGCLATQGHEIEITPMDVPCATTIPWQHFQQAIARGQEVDLKQFEMSKERNAKKKPDHTFIVKVQVCLTGESQPMLVYNKTRKFQCHIGPADPHYRKIEALIQRKGVMGQKAYFNAYVTQKKTLMLVTEPVLAPQPW